MFPGSNGCYVHLPALLQSRSTSQRQAKMKANNVKACGNSQVDMDSYFLASIGLPGLQHAASTANNSRF